MYRRARSRRAMGLESLDYDASVADFFIFYQIFSRAPRSRNVRFPNGMCVRDHRRRVVDVTRDGVVDADAPSRAPHTTARAPESRARRDGRANDGRLHRRRRGTRRRGRARRENGRGFHDARDA
jgi:hypothetical protein